MKIPKAACLPQPLSGKGLAEHVSSLLKQHPLTVEHLAGRPEFQKNGRAQHDYIAVFRHVVKQYTLTSQGKMRFRESNGRWQCSYALLAHQLNLSKDKTRRILKELHDRGLVVITQKTIYAGGNPIPYVTFLEPDLRALPILGQPWNEQGLKVSWQGPSLENRKGKLRLEDATSGRGVWANQGTGACFLRREVWLKTPYPNTVIDLQPLNYRLSDRLPVFGNSEGSPESALELGADLLVHFGSGDTTEIQAAQELQSMVGITVEGKGREGERLLQRAFSWRFYQQLLQEEPARQTWSSIPLESMKDVMASARKKSLLSGENYLTLVIRKLDHYHHTTKSVTTQVVTDPVRSQVQTDQNTPRCNDQKPTPPAVSEAVVSEEEKQNIENLGETLLERLNARSKDGKYNFQAFLDHLNSRKIDHSTLPT